MHHRKTWCDRHRRLNSIAHPFLLGFSPGRYRPRNVAIRDHTDRFQVLDAFDYGNFAAVVSDHHLGRLPQSVLRRAAARSAIMMSLSWFTDGELLFILLI